MENCPELQGPELLLGFHHMDITDEIIGRVTEYGFQTSLCFLEVGIELRFPILWSSHSGDQPPS